MISKNKSPNHRHCRLLMESLEDRFLLTSNIVLWGIDSRLSVSFVPDETVTANFESNLFAQFEDLGPPGAWQETILRAFQTWAQHANVDIALADDDGSEMGTAGATTGDSRFGDVRIAAIPMETDIFATSIPTNEYVDGTWVGDLLFNSNAEIESLDQLFAVAVHEAGHIFGLEHTSDPNSPMHLHDVPTSTELTANDISTLQANFGIRQPDAYEQEVLPSIELSSDDDRIPAIVFAGLHDSTDMDEYTIVGIEDYVGPLTVRLITDGVSLLRPNLTVLSADGQVISDVGFEDSSELGQVVTLDQYSGQSGSLVVQINADAAEFYDVGDYTIVVALDDPKKVPPNTPNDPQGEGKGLIRRRVETLARTRVRDMDQNDVQAFFGVDFSEDSVALIDNDPEAAEADDELEPVGSARFIASTSLSNANDVDTFRFAPPTDLADGAVITVSLVSLSENDRFRARAIVGRADNAAVGTTAIINNEHATVLQLDDVSNGEELTIEVGRHVESQRPVGNYELVVQIGAPPATRHELASDVLNQATPERRYDLTVNRTQLFQFGLAEVENTTGSNLIASIFSRAGELVGVFATTDALSTETMLLPPGDYEVVVTTESTITEGEVSFRFLGNSVDEPLGPEPVDPTDDPFCGFEWLTQFFTCLRVAGDVDGDGQVTFLDFLRLANNFGSEDAERTDGDLNGDFTVDFLDFLILADNFGREPRFEEPRIVAS